MHNKIKKIYSQTPYSLLCVVILVLLFFLVSRLISLRGTQNPLPAASVPAAEIAESEATPEPTPEPTPRPVVTPPPTPVPDEAKQVTETDFFFDENGRAFYSGEPYHFRFGIDVSEHQNDIDWNAAASDGVEFAIIRCGYRGYTKGGLNEDSCFRRNIQGAADAGIPVGVYFFSQAVNTSEAVEEAEYVLELINGCELELPVIYDWEIQTVKGSRTRHIGVGTATKCAAAFCERIEQEGLETGIYCIGDTTQCAFRLSELEGKLLWFFLGEKTPPAAFYDKQLWQYSSKGMINGIEGECDLNLFLELKQFPSPKTYIKRPPLPGFVYFGKLHE